MKSCNVAAHPPDMNRHESGVTGDAPGIVLHACCFIRHAQGMIDHALNINGHGRITRSDLITYCKSTSRENSDFRRDSRTQSKHSEFRIPNKVAP